MSTAAWVSAILTLLAILVALFKDELIRLWRHPSLNVTIKLSPPDCHKTKLKVGNILGDCYDLRIRVENKGNLRADNVQVFAAKLFRQQADGIFKEEEHFSPMNLVWSISKKSFTEGISPKMGMHCDLGHIFDPKKRIEAERGHIEQIKEAITILVLDLEAARYSGVYKLTPGTYRLELKIAASNAKPITKTLEIYLTGEWYDSEERMFSDGIGLKLV